MRRRIALAVIVLHGLLLWLLAVGFREPEDRHRPELQLVSLWITQPAPAPPAPETVAPTGAAETTSNTSSVDSPPALPAPVTPPLDPRSDTNTPSAITSAPLVDWAGEASIVAGNVGKAIGGPPPRESFSEAPKGMPKPCEPRESSMEWNGAANPGVHWSGPIPVLVTERCIFTIGFFSCVLGWMPPPNDKLLEDMKDPTRSSSSVPHPNICD